MRDKDAIVIWFYGILLIILFTIFLLLSGCLDYVETYEHHTHNYDQDYVIENGPNSCQKQCINCRDGQYQCSGCDWCKYKANGYSYQGFENISIEDLI